jgi:hypothetical protein
MTSRMRGAGQRSQFTIAGLMVVVLLFAVVLAAMRNSSGALVGVLHIVAVALLATSVLGAIMRRGRSRADWLGCAVFAWTYYITNSFPNARFNNTIANMLPGELGLALGTMAFGVMGRFAARILDKLAAEAESKELSRTVDLATLLERTGEAGQAVQNEAQPPSAGSSQEVSQ